MARSRRLSDPVTLRPWPSFADALAAALLVLVFIITILSIFSGKVLDELDGKERAREAQSELDADFALLVAANGMRVERDGQQIRILLPERLLFGSGRADLSDEGRALILRLGGHLAERTRGSVRVAGHTDDQPIRGALTERFPTNWELSTARATTVVRLLVEGAGIEGSRLSAEGFGAMRPVASNEDEAGRAQNRRIEIEVEP